MMTRPSHRVGARTRRAAVALLLCVPFSVSADGAPERVVYDRELGELSPGTTAPDLGAMMSAIDNASPAGLTAMLEYGERVECLECIPKLEAKLLASDSSEVREIAAWWLRKRPFGYARAAVAMRGALRSDDDHVRRARAAEALGEFLDPGGVPALQHAIASDASTEVRLSAVRALGRLNARSGQAAIVDALDDEQAQVRRAALDQVLRLSFFDAHAAVIERLSDASAAVRLRAAQIAGERRLAAARVDLEGMLEGDASIPARQAAAWALGRLGAARDALMRAQQTEREDLVRDAIRVALRMPR